MADWQGRLKRLMALAEDQAGTPEGDLAARLARDIMVRRNRQLSTLQPSSRDSVDPFVRVPLDLGGRAHWRRELSGIVAQHCECVCSIAEGHARLSGRRSGVLVSEYLYKVMSRCLKQEQVAWLGTNDLLDDPVAARNFSQSAVLALRHRLRQIREQEVADHSVTALVCADFQALRQWLAKQGVRLQVAAPFGFALSQDGYQVGYSIPLHDAVETGDSESDLW